MNRSFCVVAAVLGGVLTASAVDLATPIRWIVQRDRPATLKITEIRRGNSLSFEPQFTDYGKAVDLTGVWTVSFNFKASGSTNVHTIAGGVLNATNGTVYVPWSAANELTNTSLSWDITVGAASSTMCQAFGTMNFTPSVGYQCQTSAQQSIYVLDFAQAQLFNVGLAPFLSSYELDDVRAFIASIQTSSGDINTKNVSVAGTLTYTNWPDYLARTNDVVTNIVNGGTSTNPSISRSGGNITITFPTGGSGDTGLSGSTWTSSVPITIGIGGSTVLTIGTNGITMLRGGLELYDEDLDCNVRLYDGSRLAPSLTPRGHPGTIGMYVRGYSGSYGYAFAHASNDIAIIHAGGVTLLGTNMQYTGRGGGLSGIPQTGIVGGWSGNWTNVINGVTNVLQFSPGGCATGTVRL